MESSELVSKIKKENPLKASTKGLDAIIASIMALIFFLCPLFFTGMAAQGIGFEKMILFYFLVLLGLVAWVTKGVIQGELNIRRTPLDIPIIAAVAVFAVSTLFSVNPKDSLIGAYGNSAKGLAALVVFALFYFLVVNNLNTKRIKIMFWSLVASISVLAAYSLLQLFNIHILPFFEFTQNRSFNPVGTLSALTMLLAASLPLLTVGAAQAGEIIGGKKKKPLKIAVKAVLGAVLLGALAILAMLNGFTFWPVTIIGIVIVLMFFLSKIIKISSNNLIIPLAVFLLLIILLVLGNFSFFDLRLPAEVSLSRGASWDIAKSAVLKNPLFGSGPSTFYYNFSKFKDQSFNDSRLWNVRFDNASGSFFELLATVGSLGVIAVAVVALVAVSISFLTLTKTKENDLNSIQLGLFASFISIILFCLLFAQNNSLILTSVIISVLAAASGIILYPEKSKVLKLSFRASPKFALALAAIFLCVSAGVVVLFTMGLKLYLADVYAREAQEENAPREAAAKLQRAISLAPYQDVYYIRLANNYMGQANQAALAGKDQAEIGGLLSQAIEYGKQGVSLAENKAGHNEALALVYENASFYTRGALEWAEQLYEKVIELDPRNPTPSLRLALVNMARANMEEDQEEKRYFTEQAIEKYDEAIKKKGDLAAAYYGKGIAYEKLDNKDDAIEQLRQAILVARDNLDYRFELGRLYFNRGVSQPKLGQTASQQIAENDIAPPPPPAAEEGEEGTSTPEQAEISVEPQQQETGAVVSKNEDLRAAEQLFLSIVQANENHANALYSLAVLYQKTGEDENARMVVERLMEVVKDDNTLNVLRQQFAEYL